ncbi:GFA family protein [Billgrantia zhangzhouensis]
MQPRRESMLLGGFYRCGAVRFSVESPHPDPSQHCYCSICRKNAGSGGTPST